MNSITTIRSVGVDWLTVTASEGKQHDLLREYGIELMMADAAAGNRVTPFYLRGYTGGGTRRIQVGERGPSVLVRLMGGIADSEWPEALALAQGCSRIDLQVSAKQEPFDRDLAIRTWQTAKDRADGEGKPPQYDLYARRHAGSTLYIGDRRSRYFARLYDRWAKTKDDDDMGVWRYEVECKRERAVQMAGLVQQAARPDVAVAAIVYDHFSRRGVSPIFTTAEELHPPALPTDKPDKARSLKWLAHSVRPVLERLAAWNATSEAEQALGLIGGIPDPQGDLLDDDRHS